MQNYLPKNVLKCKIYSHVGTAFFFIDLKRHSALLPQQSPTMSVNSPRREMDNYRESQKFLLLECNSYWHENNNSAVVSQTTLKQDCGLSSYFCLWKSLFVLNMSYSSPSVAHHATWPCVVGFLVGKKPSTVHRHELHTNMHGTDNFLWALYTGEIISFDYSVKVLEWFLRAITNILAHAHTNASKASPAHPQGSRHHIEK